VAHFGVILKSSLSSQSVKTVQTKDTKQKDLAKTLKLFVGVALNKPLSVHSISNWLKQVIKEAYVHEATHDVRSVNRVTAHEFRAVSSSLACHKHVPIKQIMAKGFWKSDTCFTSFYLKDLTRYTRDSADLETVSAGFNLQI
jgi:hypothetical protein